MYNIQSKLTLFIFLTLFLFGCSISSDKSETATPSKDRFESKHEPSDEFFLQRSYPDGIFHIDAYKTGLEEARQKTLQRTITAGFDADWSQQGPGNIGARINTIAVHPTNENIIYAGFSHGGVYKTIDGGLTWIPIFDDQLFSAIGDIVLDPNDPETVYVGTGDVNISGYPFIGDGLYKSIDGGNSWTNIGLEAQRIISKVIVHPTEPNTVYAACMGLPFERNNERGLYKTTDGGSNWEQVLFLSDSTGVIDLLMDFQNPDILYASGWDRIRNNTESITKGEGARIYKTTDGGDNWTLLEGGLPNETHSRTGLAMSGTDPNVIFAQYVNTGHQLEAIYKSMDGGLNWLPIPTDEDLNGLNGGALGGFGWYFGKIKVNPNNDDDIFLLGVDLWRTLDGGQNWFRATPPWWEYSVHADKHDLVFHSEHVFLATDGGLYKMNLMTEEWADIENIPATQFYRVAYNPHSPDLYYGGAQDNGTTGGNAAIINDWSRIYGGDGFQMLFDPFDPDRFFVETQNGSIRVSLDGGMNFNGATNGIESNDRRNWDMPYIMSSHDQYSLFTGTHRVYSGVGEIPEWVAISEDLTDGEAEQHRYHNITALDESTLEQGLLYVGTGDGNVWRTDNFGGTWIAINNGLPDQYVTDIQASPEDSEKVYITYSGYRDNDFIPRIYRSDDRGLTWTSIATDLPDLAINELLIYPEHADSVLFVATDGGVYGTINRGDSWDRLGGNMPFLTIYDLVWNETKNELVAGTFGRSIMTFPLDSLGLEADPMVSNQEPFVAKINPVKVYPNPAMDAVNIEINNIEAGRVVEFVILDTNGKLIYQSKPFSEEKIKAQLNISDWPSGTYFLKAKNRHQVNSVSFIKI